MSFLALVSDGLLEKDVKNRLRGSVYDPLFPGLLVPCVVFLFPPAYGTHANTSAHQITCSCRTFGVRLTARPGQCTYCIHTFALREKATRILKWLYITFNVKD